MKIHTALLIITAPALYAGSPEISMESPKEDWITPTLNIRSRYEFGDINGFDPSHSFTFRERVGLKTMEWSGFSAVVEGEFTQAVIDDYHGGAVGVDPFDLSNTTIADPETNELNQFFAQYKGFDTVAKIGRQRIIYDNAAFIGNVGWRQNEQTFDGISFTNKSIDSLTFNYAYLNQINRIFGSDADGAALPNVQDIEANVHLLNASYAGIKGITLGAYAYIMNFQEFGGWDNNTFGLSAKGKALGLDLYGELAWQDKASATGDEDALYTHLTATKVLGKQSVTLGLEHLDAGFKTPLATVHAFNGYADAFIVGRLGGTHRGLSNLYVAHTLPVFWGMKWTNTLHAMGDNEISTGYGWEIDSVLAKKFNDQFSALAKLAHFESEGDAFVGAAALPTTTRFTVELNYEF
jgi:hypothetical protein